MNNINLENVTLYCVDTINPEIATEALKKSSENIKFKKVVLFSDNVPFNLEDSFSFIKIDKINSLLEYSKFIMNILPDFIDTEFAMSVHADGFIVNSHNWNPEFLNYDYIGAPWDKNAHFITPENRVGNGGVSIRSKKLMDLVKDLPCKGHEDTEICQRYKSQLVNSGIKFAPKELAAKFCVEKVCDDLHTNIETESFAFHGKLYSQFHKKNIRDLHFDFYKNSLIKMNDERLFKFLDEEVGVSQTDYFCAKFAGNLQVQQIPVEYLGLLNFFKSNNISTYLELGVANGGSFFINSIFSQKTTNLIHCVDCLAYKDAPHVQQTFDKINNKVSKLKEFFPEKTINFFNMTTDEFFDQNSQTYDCIFIDADHSYEGVMKDYVNSLKFVNKNGWLIFHDINNDDTGVCKAWNEVKNNHKIESIFSHEFSKGCGIGILRME
jgi:hypothetical protein